MTCVLSSTWQPFTTSYGWSPMNPGSNMPTSASGDKPQHGYASSESESRQQSSSSGKKRASRAGTRSVTTLSAAQLERKRANDREAQRAIRQRTKDHIDSLERNVNELRASQDASEKMVAVTQQRNRELEDENAYLRAKLGESGYPISIPAADNQRQQEHSMLSVHQTSPAAQAGSSIQRPDSTSAPRSNLSLQTAQPSVSRHTSWQQTPSSLGASTASTTPTLSAPGSIPVGSGLTTWRSHESSPSIHSNPGQMQDPSQAQTQAHYASSNPHDRPQWAATQSYSYQDQSRSQQFEAGQPQAQYAQSAVPAYTPGAAPQQAAYPSAQPPQAEFQGMAVSSPAGYQQGFPPSAHYPMGAIQVSPAPSNPEYPPQQGHMQQPPISAASYHPVQGDPQYAQQQMPANMQFRDDGSNRGYSLTHYPSG